MALVPNWRKQMSSYGQKPGWWVRAKAAHWSHVGPFDTAVEAAEYAQKHCVPANGWSRISITYKSTTR